MGFLPGDLAGAHPYLTPTLRRVIEMLGFEKSKPDQRNVIEVAPLAYMRGRTLNDAFIILMRARTPPSNR
ncbi:PhoH family protein [Shigella boydii]